MIVKIYNSKDELISIRECNYVVYSGHPSNFWTIGGSPLQDGDWLEVCIDNKLYGSDNSREILINTGRLI